MKQLPLELAPRAEPAFDNFVPGPNAEALERVAALATGELREPLVYLWGHAGCGRTHLLRAAARRNPALVLADDVERLAPEAQQALFNSINDARDGGPAVLAAGGKPPAQLALREDLRTRLAWGLVYQLRPLGDEDKIVHLKAEAARRGLGLGDEVAAYLLARMPRDLASLRAVLERLDRLALARSRGALSIPLVRELLGEGGEKTTSGRPSVE